MVKVSPLILDDALNFFRRRSRNRCRALFHLHAGRFSQGSSFSQQQRKSVQLGCASRQLHLLDEHRLVVQPHLTSSMTAFGAGRRGVMTGTPRCLLASIQMLLEMGAQD